MGHHVNQGLQMYASMGHVSKLAVMAFLDPIPNLIDVVFVGEITVNVTSLLAPLIKEQ